MSTLSQEGTGIEKMIPHIAADCVDLIVKLLAYNPDERLSARQGLRHPWFRDLREAEKRGQATSKTMSPAPLSPAPSQSSVVTAKSNETKVSKVPTREGKNKDDGLPSISKGDSKKHSNVDSSTGGHDSQLLPPIGKPVSLMIDSTKKMVRVSHGQIPTYFVVVHLSILCASLGAPLLSAPLSLTLNVLQHKTQPKPAPTLQQKTKHSQMVAASRRKKDDKLLGLTVYSKTSMTDTSRSGKQ